MPFKKPQGTEPAVFEFQIHPRDFRKQVRYLFITRRQLWQMGIGAGLYGILLICALIVAPGVVSDLWREGEAKSLRSEKTLLSARLGGLKDRLEALEGPSHDLRLRIDKIFLVYGLSSDATSGQGGYPLSSEGVEDPSRWATLSPESRSLAIESARLEVAVREQVQVAGSFLSEITAFEEARRDQVRTTPAISPLMRDDFTLTSPFGNRRNPFTEKHDFHAGVDMAAPTGTVVRAPADGRVLFAGQYPLRRSVGWWRYGNMVMLRNGDHFTTIFGHCDEVRVETGDRVHQGQIIATVGSTGMSTNPHLHYEIRRRGEDDVFRPVDPRIYILDLRWAEEEALLVASRSAPPATGFQPLPPLARR